MATNRTVFFLSSSGSGFADTVNLRGNETITQFLNRQMDGFRPDRYTIRVNSKPVDADYVLKAGDRVSTTPRKMSGALSY